MEVKEYKVIAKNNKGKITEFKTKSNIGRGEIIIDNEKLIEIISFSNNLTTYTETLSFSNNKIKKLPNINEFKNLISLWVENNELTSLPQLPHNLKDLYCQYNKIEKLPDLIELEYINCDMCCFEDYMLEMKNTHFNFYC